MALTPTLPGNAILAADIEQYRSLSRGGLIFDAKNGYGVEAGAPAAVNTPLINGVIEDAAIKGGTVVFPSGIIDVGTIAQRPGITLEGQGSVFAGSLGTVLRGTAGMPILTFPSGLTSDYRVRNLQLVGGLDSIQNLNLATHVFFDEVVFAVPERAGLYIEGSIEEWYFNRCKFVGGVNPVWFTDVPWSTVNYIDKTQFNACTFSGGSQNNIRLEGFQLDSVNFIDPVITSSGEHGVYVDSGARGLRFDNPVTENNGSTGKNARTTATVNASSTAATLASATGWTTGNPITIRGAGANGTDLTTTIASLTGTAATLAVAAGTSVVAAPATNASWDDFHFSPTGGAADTIFLGGFIGGEGSIGKLRYSLRVGGTTTAIGLQTGMVPAYDEAHLLTMVGGSGTVRAPNSHVGQHYEQVQLGTGDQHHYNVVPSAGGGDLILALRSLANDLATFGKIEVRLDDANKTVLLQLLANGQLYIQGHLIGADGVTTLVVAGPVTDGAFQTTPPNGTFAVDSTNSQLYVRINATWRKVAVT